MPPVHRTPPPAVPTAAPPADAPAGSRETLEPPDWQSARNLSLVGLALVAVAAILTLLQDFLLPSPVPASDAIRLGLVGVGGVAVGHALARRGERYELWAIAALAGYLAGGVAVPAAWDSFRLLFWILAAVATAGACLAAMPAHVRYPAIGCLAVVHFGGILTATTSPDPSPWLSATLGTRLYMPYLQFCYLRNAYHFYSPEPGPASLLLSLVTYELDEPGPDGNKAVSEWHAMPRRAEQTSDPLGISYYRRLSLTEYSSAALPDTGLNLHGLGEVRERRQQVAAGLLPNQKKIPLAPPDYEPPGRSYQVPTPKATRYTLPSYARHIAFRHTAPGRRVVNVRLYRVEHRIPTAQSFVTLKEDPYHPTMFRCYFLGDYDPRGKVVNPDDPMLYWLVPVLKKSPELPSQNWSEDQIEDYLSVHAGFAFDWRSLRP